MLSLKNKIVLVTGASSGIGAAAAKQFAQSGAKLILCARRLDKLELVKTELENQFNTEILTIQLDVRKPLEVSERIKALPAHWKAIDILLNNAGLAAGLDPIQTGDVNDWEAMIDTNVKGLLYVTKALLPEMISRNSGHIINIGSVASHQVYPKGAVYCASKYAVKALSEGLRMDLLGSKIRVSSIDPGAVETDFSLVRFKGDRERAAAVYQGLTPLTPEDIADTILYCATRPAHVNISQIIMMPTNQASATLFYRETKE